MRLLEFGTVFLLGFFSCVFILSFNFSTDLEIPFGFGGNSVNAPVNRIVEDDIIIYDDSIVLKVSNATISRYANSGSMKPVLDKGANGIRIVPKSEEDIDVGDIVTYRFGGRLIVHRVVDKGEDGEGAFFVMKGDNNDFNDGKVRFSDIRYVTIGVLY